MSVEAHFTEDHRRCDELWAAVEEVGHDPQAASARFADFDRAMRQHFAMEEEVLFPALESATGMRGGPTEVMRVEHAQMTRMLDAMATSIKTGEIGSALEQGDTLLMMIQQHNVKEESMLYPMAEQALGHTWPELAERLRKYT